jgi:hypothetical protein
VSSQPVIPEPHDPDLAASLPALRRAADQARALSERTGTPFYVYRDGQVLDLNAGALQAAEPPATYRP